MKILSKQIFDKREYAVLTGDQIPENNIILTKVNDLIKWSRQNSLWFLTFGLACCAIEMISTNSPRYDLDRFGIIPRGTPRQADLMIVAGTVTQKMAPVVRRLYDQMPEPKYVIAMGSCAINGGPFYHDTYTIVEGVDKVIPVDVYVPGCPPRPEALIYGINKLRESIMSGREPSKEVLDEA